MIAAPAKGAQVFDMPEYADAARRAADFILSDMRRQDGRILHRYRDGQAAILANVDDYAFLIWGLLELYELNFDVHYLQTALDLNNEMIKHFWDNQNGGFYFTADEEAPDITRLAKFTKHQLSIDGKATAYVCLDYACKMPATNTKEMLKLLNVSSSK